MIYNYKLMLIIISSILFYFLLGAMSLHIFFNYFTFLPPDNVNLISQNEFILFFQKPTLFILAIIICLIIEKILLKSETGSYGNIKNFSSLTVKTDIFYMWIKISGVSDLLFNVLFLGFGFYLMKLISEFSLIELNNYLYELVIMFLFTTFLHYWYHRLMHHKFFWELHKLHHSATEMNVLTASREHPLVVSISTILLSLPVFIFGVSVEIVFIYAAVSGMYDLFLHSKVNLVPKWARLFMIDTLTHYIHHSKYKEHYNSNFGNMFVIWDKLFKTYIEPKDNEKVVIGIPNNNYNTGNYFQEIYLVIIRWFNSLKNQKLM